MKIVNINKLSKKDLVRIIFDLQKKMQLLEDELARFKNRPKRPKLKPSTISKKDKSIGKKPSKKKQSFSKESINFKVIDLKPKVIPNGSRFITYKSYKIQDIKFYVEHIEYKIHVYKTPDGKCIRGQLPDDVTGHYGNSLRGLVLEFYYSLHIPQNMIHTYLTEHGISISAGQVNNILVEQHTNFKKEADKLLEVGLKHSNYITVDDTGMRHKGKNGYSTHIGNEYFAYFKSSDKKNRISFLQDLLGVHIGYSINEASIAYIQSYKLPDEKIVLLKRLQGYSCSSVIGLLRKLKFLCIREKQHIKCIIESALIGHIYKVYQKELIIVSDEAGQFNVFNHALCWIHTERKINGLLPINDLEAKKRDDILKRFWEFYKQLKAYKEKPEQLLIKKLENEFDTLFTEDTGYKELNKVLYSIHKNKDKLLKVLYYPFIPLHTNNSENDIREVVKKRKINLGTRSERGRSCRDTFMTLKKTCKKLNISFSQYLMDRINKTNNIPFLYEIIPKLRHAS